MKIQLAVASSPTVYFHGTKKKFTQFSEYRPAFFTRSEAYANEYGPILLRAHLKMQHVFDTRTDKRAVEVFNDYFLSSGLARPNTKKIKLGVPVHMNDADELWSYLAVPEYPAPHYDGIVVSESSPSAIDKKFKDADMAYVPLHVNQIHLVNK